MLLLLGNRHVQWHCTPSVTANVLACSVPCTALRSVLCGILCAILLWSALSCALSSSKPCADTNAQKSTGMPTDTGQVVADWCQSY
jgi:MFS superfamily sulfate permease-like transporter